MIWSCEWYHQSHTESIMEEMDEASALKECVVFVHCVSVMYAGGS